MKIFSVFLKSVLLIGICFLFLSSANAQNDRLPEPKIHAGTASVSGKVINFHPEKGKESPVLTMYIPNPITAEPGKFETHLSEDGSFHFEVPTESNTTLGCIVSGIYTGGVCVFLASDEDTKLEIIFDERGNIKANMSGRSELTSDDIISSVNVLTKMERYRLSEPKPIYSMELEDYIPYAITSLESKLQLAVNDSALSKSAKNYIVNEFKLIYLYSGLFDYKI